MILNPASAAFHSYILDNPTYTIPECKRLENYSGLGYGCKAEVFGLCAIPRCMIFSAVDDFTHNGSS